MYLGWMCELRGRVGDSGLPHMLGSGGGVRERARGLL